MEYAEFEVEYKRAFELVVNGLAPADMSSELARLHTLADRIDDEDDREEARSELVGLEDALAHDDDDAAPSEVILQARRVFAEADRKMGRRRSVLLAPSGAFGSWSGSRLMPCLRSRRGSALWSTRWRC